MDQAENSQRRGLPKWLPQVLGYTISVVCLAWVLHGYPLGELIPNIRALDFRWVLLAVVADLAVYLVQAWRWNTLLGPVARLGLWRTVQAVYIGLFADEVLPLRPGEVIRVYLVTHWNDIRLSLGFASWGVERIIDGLWLLVTFFITAGFVRGVPANLVIAVEVGGALLVIAALVLIWVMRRRQEEPHVVVSEGRWASTLRHVREGLQLMGNWRTLGYTTAISLGFVALQVVTLWALMKAYGLDLGFWVGCGVLTIMRVGTVVPNAPGDVGVIQFACVMALSLFEVEKNDAKTFSFIYLLATRLPLLAAGAVATALTGLNLGELHRRARRGHQAGQGETSPEEQ
ncbi:MAG TPA: lysylphosphatidylglycerol synthase transmembrane domain-containing protein [Bryobacteraceae bacterium]|nr:lysylphosphatidylglycerol synthase transmembrane domain-containing protein [Bryobacteraceae bacterium]